MYTYRVKNIHEETGDKCPETSESTRDDISVEITETDLDQLITTIQYNVFFFFFFTENNPIL